MRAKYLISFLIFVLIFGLGLIISCEAKKIIEEEIIEVEERQEKDEVDLKTKYMEKTTEQIKEENIEKEKERWISNNPHWKIISLAIIIVLVALAFVLWRYSVIKKLR